MEFGKKLQELREKAGLSQSELGAKSGIPTRTIQNWEITDRVPRADALFKLAAALGVDCRAFADSVQAKQEKRAAKRASSRRKGK
jgi:transcriptional regulator with XRE-family HTH domain